MVDVDSVDSVIRFVIGFILVEGLVAFSSSVKSLLGGSESVKCCVESDDEVIICSHAAKLLQYLDIEHPAGFIINDACQGMYKRYGTGCKTLVCMIGFWSRAALDLQQQGLPVSVISRLNDEALSKCIEEIEKLALPLDSVLQLKGSQRTRKDVISSSVLRSEKPSLLTKSSSTSSVCWNSNTSTTAGVPEMHQDKMATSRTLLKEVALPTKVRQDNTVWLNENAAKQSGDAPVNFGPPRRTEICNSVLPRTSACNVRDVSCEVVTYPEIKIPSLSLSEGAVQSTVDADDYDEFDACFDGSSHDSLAVTSCKWEVRQTSTCSSTLKSPGISTYTTLKINTTSERDADEFDECFDGICHSSGASKQPPKTIANKCHRSDFEIHTILDDSLESSHSSIRAQAKGNKNTKCNDAVSRQKELAATEKMLEFLGFSGTKKKLEGSVTSRHHSEIMKSCRNFSPSYQKTPVVDSSLNEERTIRTSNAFWTKFRTKDAQEFDHGITHKENLEFLGKMLSRGKSKEMSLAVQVVHSQISKRGRIGEYKVDTNLVHVEPIFGPNSCRSRVVDGLLLKQGSELGQKFRLGNLRAVLVNGEITEHFQHVGFKDSFQARRVITVGDSLLNGSTKIPQPWIEKVLGVLQTFNIGAVFAKGAVEESVVDFCLASKIAVFQNVPHSILQLLSHLTEANLIVYVTDLQDSDVATSVAVTTYPMQETFSVTCTPAFGSKDTPKGVPYALIRTQSEKDIPLQTVLLCAPSRHLLCESELTFWSCVHRLKNTISSGRVLEGAGHVEAVCVRMLENLADKQEGSIDEPSPISSSWLEASLPSYRPAVYRAFAGGLREFLASVLMNAGSPQCQAVTLVQQLISTGSVKTAIDPVDGSADHLHELCSSTGEPSSVVDDFTVKLEAWRRAVGVVRLLLQSDLSVVTGIQEMDQRDL